MNTISLKSQTKNWFIIILIICCSALGAFAQTTWTGATSTAWNVASNWSAGVPTATSGVTIANTANKPILSAATTITNLTLNIGATLTTNADLTVTGETKIFGGSTLNIKSFTFTTEHLWFPRTTNDGKFAYILSDTLTAASVNVNKSFSMSELTSNQTNPINLFRAIIHPKLNITATLDPLDASKASGFFGTLTCYSDVYINIKNNAPSLPISAGKLAFVIDNGTGYPIPHDYLNYFYGNVTVINESNKGVGLGVQGGRFDKDLIISNTGGGGIGTTAYPNSWDGAADGLGLNNHIYGTIRLFNPAAASSENGTLSLVNTIVDKDVNIDLGTNGKLNMALATFNGNLTVKAASVQIDVQYEYFDTWDIRNCTFNKNLTITKTGSADDIWMSGNKYQGTTLITNEGTGKISMNYTTKTGTDFYGYNYSISNARNPQHYDDFNGDLTIIQKTTAGTINLISGIFAKPTFAKNINIELKSNIQYNGTAIFDGTADQNLATTSTSGDFNVNFKNIRMAQSSSSNNLNLSSTAAHPVYVVRDTTQFGTGKIVLGGTDLDMEGNVIAVSSNSYAVAVGAGTVIRPVTGSAAAVDFPTGTTSFYFPIKINTSTTDRYKVRMHSGVATTYSASPTFAAGSTAITNDRFVDAVWIVKDSVVGGTAQLTPGWFAGAEQSKFNRDTAQVIRYNNVAGRWGSLLGIQGKATGGSPYYTFSASPSATTTIPGVFSVVVAPPPVLTGSYTAGCVTGPVNLVTTFTDVNKVGAVITYYADTTTGTKTLKDTASLIDPLIKYTAVQAANINKSGRYFVVHTKKYPFIPDSVLVDYKTADIKITPAAPVLTTGQDTVKYCKGDTKAKALTPSGKNYVWYNSSNTVISTPTPVTTTVGTTKYSVSIKDTVFGCESTKSIVTVIINDVPVITTVPATACSPSKVDLIAVGVTTGSTANLTYTYFTDAGLTTTLGNASAVSASGTYYIKGTTAAGCSNSASIVVTINPQPSFTISKTDAATCAGKGSATITITSTSGNFDIDLNGDGTYEYLNQAPSSNLITLDNLSLGTVLKNVKIRSVNTGCASVANPIDTSITAPAAPTNTTSSVSLCADGVSTKTLVGSPSGGTWSLASGSTANIGTISGTTFTVGLVSGTAILRYTSGGCDVDVAVIINPKPTVITTGTVIVCAPSTVDLTAPAVTTGSTAGLTYTYYTDAGLTTALVNPSSVSASGTYYIKGTTVGTCSSSDTVEVTVDNSSVNFDLGDATKTICSGGSALITALDSKYSNTSKYSWSWVIPSGVTGNTSADTMNATQSGNYQATITVIGTTCTNSDVVNVSIGTQADLGLPDAATACGNANPAFVIAPSISGNVSDYTFTWVGIPGYTQPTYTPTSSGKYKVTVKDKFGCKSEDSTYVTYIAAFQAKLIKDTSICVNANKLGYKITAALGFDSYSWNSAAPTTNPVFNGTAPVVNTLIIYEKIKVTVTKSSCSATDSAVIQFINKNSSSLGEDITVCVGQSVFLYPGKFSDYAWHSEALGDSIISRDTAYTAVSPGNYSVDLTSTCITQPVKITIFNYDSIKTKFTTNATFCIDESVLIQDENWLTESLKKHAINEGFQYQWVNTLTKDTIERMNHQVTFDERNYGPYKIIITDKHGCDTTAFVTTTITEDCFMIPNLITPNGDPYNQTFVVKGLSKIHKDWAMTIFNRWGDKVYYNPQYENEWDAKGLSDGVYYFLLKSGKKNKEYKGWVQVAR